MWCEWCTTVMHKFGDCAEGFARWRCERKAVCVATPLFYLMRGFTRCIHAPRPSGSCRLCESAIVPIRRPRATSLFLCAAKESDAKSRSCASRQLLLHCSTSRHPWRSHASATFVHPCTSRPTPMPLLSCASRYTRVRQTGHPWPCCRMARVLRVNPPFTAILGEA